MLDYPAAHAVMMVVRTGSFEKAANALNVTPSAVSQRVRQLEERLGAVLVVRGSPCVATETGEWLCRHMEHVGMLESALMQQFPLPVNSGASAARVTINVAANADSLETWFLNALADFSTVSDHLLDIAVDDQEHTAEWLKRGRVLAAVTSLDRPVQGCRCIPLGALHYCATASPAFMERYFREGVTPETLAHAPALAFNRKDNLQAQWIRQVLGRDVILHNHWLPSTHGFVTASLLGLGWGMNPIQLVRDHLAAGRLVEMLPDSPLLVPLFWQVSRLADDSIAPLTLAIIQAAKANLMQT